MASICRSDITLGFCARDSCGKQVQSGRRHTEAPPRACFAVSFVSTSTISVRRIVRRSRGRNRMVNDAGVRRSTQCGREGLVLCATAVAAPRCTRTRNADLLHHNQCVVHCPHARRHPRRLFGAFTRVPGPDRAFKCHQPVHDLDADKAGVHPGATR